MADLDIVDMQERLPGDDFRMIAFYHLSIERTMYQYATVERILEDLGQFLFIEMQPVGFEAFQDLHIT
ncbi:MAG: hypothetical protein KF690_07100 [Bacteroidetes bacterium]|nr:hypothetical protein [Bacteroidota bacterium]